MKKKTRRVLNASGKLPCEVCDEVHFLVQHHILGRDVHKANDTSNLANICSNCHLKIHRGEIIVEKRAMTTLGYKLLWHQKDSESITGEQSIVFTY